MQKFKQKLLIITGPTGIGKSSIAVDLAIKLGGEIISCDSMQIYKGLDIGTGKIMKNEMRGVPHHMLDIVDLDKEYSVGRFKKDAARVIEDIANRGRLPIIVGGTGLYIQALLGGMELGGVVKDEAYREELGKLGKEELYDMLNEVDSEAADKISINDTKRVIRALEIFKLTGRKKSEIEREDKKKSENDMACEYDYLCIVLEKDREGLYARIEKRVDGMVSGGLVAEARGLYDRFLGARDCQFMAAIGYKELFEYFDGAMDLDKAIQMIKQNSRRYAKRQITFFKHMKINKVFVDVNEDVCGLVASLMK